MTTSPTTLAPHRFCIVNCYPAASRENFDRFDVGHAHDLFKDFLRREAPNAIAEIVYVADPGFTLPPGTSIDDFDGFIWTGSDLTVYHTDDPRVAAQIDFAGSLMREGAASWGSCWGMQLASLVAGGEVDLNPRGREWGIARDIRLTDAARRSPMLAGKPAAFDAFIMHLDVVTRLPEGTSPLATNTHSPVQAAVIEDGDASFWSTQYHPEFNLHEMARLIAARARVLVREGLFPDEAAVATYAAKMKELFANPDSAELRAELDAGDDIIDPQIRELELRNWLRFIDSRATRR
ncbi:MAG: type 1 glutamine amidotransferase [Thermomicrobiales bacterium]|nr:MAG: type 1 glutamine amidotransferase [Thermomicrobiales bacterium]